MKIAIFSVGPVFRDHVHGGSQKILREVAAHLGRAGHEVTILCTSRGDNHEPFRLAPGVLVSPTLRFKETYPEPYYTAPYNLANAIVDVRRASEGSDVLYLHDGELLYHFIYEDVPTVVSMRDFVYPDTLAGGLSFRRDLLVLNSEYVAGCVTDAFSSFRPSVISRMRLILNGVNLEHFRPRLTERIRKLIPLPEDAIPIIYPHRPDPRKGIYEAVEVVAGLRRRLGTRGDRLRLLVPIWIDGKVSPTSKHVYQTVYDEVRARAAELRVSDMVVYHPWVSYDLMPEYYSLGRATLCLGNFVEACSNVSLEATACGSRCVVSRVASHRHLLPDEFASKVQYGDVSAAVDALEAAIGPSPDADAARDFIGAKYSYERMLKGYEAALTGTTITPPLLEEYAFTLTGDQILKLPTWCDYRDGRCYNDYHYGYDDDPDLLLLLGRDALPAKVSDITSSGMSLEALERLLRLGSVTRGSAAP